MSIKSRIEAKGEATGNPDVRKIKCQGCGEYILSSEELSTVEYVKTKRRDELFFHRECTDKVWDEKIK